RRAGRPCRLVGLTNAIGVWRLSDGCEASRRPTQRSVVRTPARFRGLRSGGDFFHKSAVRWMDLGSIGPAVCDGVVGPHPPALAAAPAVSRITLIWLASVSPWDS